ncbi:hypothetical protein [Saccharopolyspora sp. CA-218241]|uniref:hypothetical protein n=1 Tax=Saccharopolyspora sp. CA-218241 TaxID=3240027 RepID=UPI003D976522
MSAVEWLVVGGFVLLAAIAVRLIPEPDEPAEPAAPEPPEPAPRRPVVLWVISPDQTRFHLSTGPERALCGHPLRGTWFPADGLDGLRPGAHSACDGCLTSPLATPRRSGQALLAWTPRTPAAAPEPATWETDEFPALIAAYLDARTRTAPGRSCLPGAASLQRA